MVGVAVLLVALVAAVLLVRKGGGGGSVASAGGNSSVDGGGALQRVVPDSDVPDPASLVGAWGFTCNGAATTVIIQGDGSAYYGSSKAAASPVLWQVVQSGGKTLAKVKSSTNPDMPLGASVPLTVRNGRLQFTVSGTSVSLFPTSEKWNGSVAC